MSPEQIREYQKGDAKRHEQERQQRIADISPSVMTAVEIALREQERQLREAQAPFSMMVADVALREQERQLREALAPISMTAADVALHERERQERQERESEAIRLSPPVFIPNLIRPHVVQPSPPASQPSGQPYSREEMAAWRRVVAVLSRTATPQKRENMAARLSERARGQTCNEIIIELGDVAKLFHPDSEERAASVLHVLQQACKSGELASYGGAVTVFHLVAWPECPPMAADSPLRFWLPDAPQLEQHAPAAGALDAGEGATVADPLRDLDADLRTEFEAVCTRRAACKDAKNGAREGWPDADLETLRKVREALGRSGAAIMAARLGIKPDSVRDLLERKSKAAKAPIPTANNPFPTPSKRTA